MAEGDSPPLRPLRASATIEIENRGGGVRGGSLVSSAMRGILGYSSAGSHPAARLTKWMLGAR